MKNTIILITLLLSSSLWAGRVEVDVMGMTCGMCVEAITKELNATQKVENVQVKLTAKKTSFDEIKGKKISDAEIRSAFKKAGDQYEAIKIRRH